MTMTPTEYTRSAILAWLSEGKTYIEIGEMLGVSNASIYMYANGNHRQDGTRYFPDPPCRVFVRCLELTGGDIQRAYPGTPIADKKAQEKIEQMESALSEIRAIADRAKGDSARAAASTKKIRPSKSKAAR